MRNKKAVYLDYAATTPVSKSVMEAMLPYFSQEYGNPSSTHVMGQKAQAALDDARANIASILRCDWKEIIFTPSATESINLALRGIVKAVGREKPHIITTNIEHSAVLNTCRELEQQGVEVTYLAVNDDGLISPRQVKDALKDETVLVSIGYVNNEIGTIQPIREISEVIQTFRSAKYPVFHTDAVQAANYLDINVENLSVDLMTLSAHKIYGPKGAALLYRKDGVDISPLVLGGGQERGFHSGTENSPAIVGFATALIEANAIKDKEEKRVRALRDKFIAKVLSGGDNITLNGSRTERVANNASFCFENKTSEVLIPALDARGIYASAGSACKARAIEPSHVIEALLKTQCVKNSIRFSFGRHTTVKDVEYAANTLIKLVAK